MKHFRNDRSLRWMGPADIAKRWVLVTLGKGAPAAKWPKQMLAKKPALQTADAKAAGRAICDRYPFLRSPADAVASAAGLDRLADLGSPKVLLTHRLVAIEAAAINATVAYLRSRGVLALPIFDGLLVPRSGAQWVQGGLDAAYGHFARIAPRTTHGSQNDACDRDVAAEATG